MNVYMLIRFFMWCTILNFAFLMLSFGLLALAGDFVYRTHRKWFPMPRETFTVVVYSFLGVYKAVWLFFNVVPWVALKIIVSQ